MALTFSSVAAQGDGSPNAAYPEYTVSVSGTGSASGAPDIAYLELGVERINADVGAAFSEANSTIDAVIAAVVEAGVAREDIRTTNLSVYSESFGPAMPGDSSGGERNYRVSNIVRITVRDISTIEDVINAAVNAGANNVYGLNFGIADTASLEQDARVEAMDNARSRAQQLAELAGAELGEIIVVSEGGSGGFEPRLAAADSAFGLGGGSANASVEAGQLSVSVTLNVTFRLVYP
jgi:hypothetical protein